MCKRVFAAVLSCVLLLSACAGQPAISQPSDTAAESTTQSTTEPTTEPTTNPTTEPTTEPTQPEVTHSPLYIPGVSVEEVIRWFNEVSLDAEFVNGGNATLLQKWDSPIFYRIHGAPTPEDLQTFQRMKDWLNSLEGFPGLEEPAEEFMVDLNIYFCTQEELLQHLGDQFAGVDGGVTFWYDGENVIYEGIICIRTDLRQEVRNSVILEELYNGLGPVQDTDLRPDSLIWSGYSFPQWMTPVDELILRLLYHPSIRCGMNAAACEAVIRSLYY